LTDKRLYKTGNTSVHFFDSEHRLMSKEVLSRRCVRLNQRNVRRLDRVLSSLMASALVASTVKSFDLVADSRTTFREVDVLITTATPELTYHHTKTTNVYLSKLGVLRVILKNPSGKRFFVVLLDERDRILHHEAIDESGYNRSFNLSGLAEGTYRISIASPDMKLSYKLRIGGILGYVLEDFN
jgi:hypothetical protein